MDPRTFTKTDVDNQTKFEEAYKRVEPELVAMSPEEIAKADYVFDYRDGRFVQVR